MPSCLPQAITKPMELLPPSPAQGCSLGTRRSVATATDPVHRPAVCPGLLVVGCFIVSCGCLCLHALQAPIRRMRPTCCLVCQQSRAARQFL